MKKILSLTLLAGMIAFSACGPSAEEKAATEKAAQDSAAAAEQMMREAEAQALEAAKPDSMAAPDSTQMPADTTQK